MHKKTLFAIILPLFLLLLSYKIVFFLTPLTEPQQETINFLQDDSMLTLNYASAEISHLEDVKKVMHYTNFLFYGLLLGVTLIFTYHRKKKKELLALLNISGKATVIFLSALLFLALTSFNFLFTVFHQIFFPQGNWMFATDSLIITTFPTPFFTSIAIKIFLLTLPIGILFILVSIHLEHDRKRERH
tara:strand:+ start:821 stop:1384 length:564 start_codon:yes stop_codon:yes gene_type:complete